MNVYEFFEKHNDQFLTYRNYDHLKDQNSEVRIVFAISEIIGKMSLFQGSRHDEVFLGGNPQTAFEVWGEERTLDMIRHGLRVDQDHECFALFT